jgi:hypothetical protein
MSNMKMKVDEEDVIEYNLNGFVEDLGENFIRKLSDIYMNMKEVAQSLIDIEGVVSKDERLNDLIPKVKKSQI